MRRCRISLCSGERKGSYAHDTAQEQEELMDATSAPDALRSSILGNAEEPPLPNRFQYRKRKLLAVLGVHQRARSFRRRYRRGAFIAALRQKRGLPSMPEREPGVDELLARCHKGKD